MFEFIMDLFKFPFQAEIWGTVSEWMMIFVTIATAYLLYKTLKSQKDVQETQNQLLKIEQLRLREDFKPNLKYSRFENQFRTDRANKGIICIAVRNVNINPALNVKSSYNESLDGKKIQQIIFKPNPKSITNDTKDYELYFETDWEEGKNLDSQILFTLEYEDIASTKYSQTVLFDAFAGKEEFKTYDAKIISRKL